MQFMLQKAKILDTNFHLTMDLYERACALVSSSLVREKINELLVDGLGHFLPTAVVNDLTSAHLHYANLLRVHRNCKEGEGCGRIVSVL